MSPYTLVLPMPPLSLMHAHACLQLRLKLRLLDRQLLEEGEKLRLLEQQVTQEPLGGAVATAPAGSQAHSLTHPPGPSGCSDLFRRPAATGSTAAPSLAVAAGRSSSTAVAPSSSLMAVAGSSSSSLAAAVATPHGPSASGMSGLCEAASVPLPSSVGSAGGGAERRKGLNLTFGARRGSGSGSTEAAAGSRQQQAGHRPVESDELSSSSFISALSSDVAGKGGVEDDACSGGAVQGPRWGEWGEAVACQPAGRVKVEGGGGGCQSGLIRAQPGQRQAAEETIDLTDD